MTNEEMQKAMQFIIEQQAQFATDIEKLTRSHSQLAEATLANTGMIGRLTDILDRLTEAQTSLAQAQAHTDAKMAEMAERLDSFIVIVEKYISEGRNGKS
jgi:hypothetical protein